MRLYIKQKVFSWGDKFTVKDEMGQDRYYVQGEVFTFGKKLHVYDLMDNEVAYIEQKVFSFLPRYYVYVGDTQVAEIVKKFTLFYQKYYVLGPEWEVDGSFGAHEYEITKGNNVVAAIHKQWMSWGDCYELDLGSMENEVLALAVVLTIDCIMFNGSNDSGITISFGSGS